MMACDVCSGVRWFVEDGGTLVCARCEATDGTPTPPKGESPEAVLHRQAIAYRCLAILACTGHDVSREVRASLVLWLFRPPEKEQVDDLVKRARVAGALAGWFAEDKYPSPTSGSVDA